MLKKIAILSALTIALSGCATGGKSSENISKPSVGVKNLELSVIKLYAKSNIDSGEIMDNVNKELKAGKTTDEIMKSYGSYFTDVKININLAERKEVDFVSTNTTAHVSGLTKDGEIIPGYYNTGVKAKFYVEGLDENRYVFRYNIKNSILKRLESSPKNKIITTPETTTREFEQSVVVDDSMNTATGITNPEPKQYELYILKLTKEL